MFDYINNFFEKRKKNGLTNNNHNTSINIFVMRVFIIRLHYTALHLIRLQVFEVKKKKKQILFKTPIFIYLINTIQNVKLKKKKKCLRKPNT